MFVITERNDNGQRQHSSEQTSKLTPQTFVSLTLTRAKGKKNVAVSQELHELHSLSGRH